MGSELTHIGRRAEEGESAKEMEKGRESGNRGQRKRWGLRSTEGPLHRRLAREPT